MPRFDITSIGETMLRYSVPSGSRLENADSLDVHVGGSESNVLAALQQIGQRCGYVTALPDNPNGRRIAHALREKGISLDAICWRTDGRVGVYYVEFAQPPRSIQVVYDRAGSCASALTPDDVDWADLLDTSALHLTGITAALSPSCYEVVDQAIRRARTAGVRVIFDVNYRARLWSAEAAAAGLMPLIQGIDLLICKEGDARLLFGCIGQDTETVIRHLYEQSGATQVVMSAGEAGAYAFDGSVVYHENALAVQIIDRLGAGDALAAGVIDGWLDGEIQRGLKWGVVLAALALTQHGDMVTTHRREVELLGSASQPLIHR
jgi:2-dehydro-3-deoxygluconokinase